MRSWCHDAFSAGGKKKKSQSGRESLVRSLRPEILLPLPVLDLVASGEILPPLSFWDGGGSSLVTECFSLSLVSAFTLAAVWEWLALHCSQDPPHFYFSHHKVRFLLRPYYCCDPGDCFCPFLALTCILPTSLI